MYVCVTAQVVLDNGCLCAQINRSHEVEVVTKIMEYINMV